MKNLFKAIDKLSSLAGIIGIALIAAMTLMLTASVLFRWLFKVSFNGTFEITQFMLAVTFLSSYAYAQTNKRHVCLSLLIKHFPDKIKYGVCAFTNLFGMGITIMLCYAFILHGQYSLSTGYASTNLHLPMWPLCFVCAAMLAVFALTLLADLIKAICAAAGNEEYREELSKGWV